MIVAVGLGLGAACTPPPTAPTPTPIGPGERFTGVVNGTATNAVIYTVCGGPVIGNRLGPVASGQTVAVRRDANGVGLTDRSGTIFARTDFTGHVVQVAKYDSPTSLDGMQVPCEGSAILSFDPCYGFVGCIAGGHAAEVKVTFINIAD